MTYLIASSREAFEIAPKAFNGFIEKRLKRRLDLTINNKLFAFNRNGIVIKRTNLENGKVWYSYTSTSDFEMKSISDEMAWVRSFAVGSDHRGLLFK